MNRYQTHYQNILCQDLLLKENYSNIFELPMLKKIILNITSKQYIYDKKYIIPTLVALELISGQKAKLTYAKKSIATFKLREGQIIGCKVSLRDLQMYRFLELFITLVLPRLRDFNGISKKMLNNSGNFSLGLENLMIFPELENHFEFFEIIKGININFIINTKSIQQASLFYSGFQLPKIK